MLKSSRPLRLMDTFRNLFYTPIYVAVAGGFFYAEGINVEFSTVPDGASTSRLLRSGIADIAQTGISRSLIDLDECIADTPLHIAEINQRDGFFLLSREPKHRWVWKDLEGSTLIPIGFTPVPWNSLRAVLEIKEIDLSTVTLFENLSAGEAITRFKNGEVDYIHLPHPYAQMLVDEGMGYMVAPLGSELGYVCYSSFAASPAFVNGNHETVQAFVNGFHKALNWIEKSCVTRISEKVAGFFPDLPVSTLEKAICQYKNQETWPQDALIGESGYYAMCDILIDGGLVKERHSYRRLVRPEFARKAIGS